MSIFLSVAICSVAFSWFRAKHLGVPWFSWGESPCPSGQTGPVQRLSSGCPDYQSRAKRKKTRANGQQKKPMRPTLDRKRAQKKNRKSAPSFNRLDELTHNAETSRRLVEHVRRLHPDRDLNWCEEKALYDMKRDRMA